MTFEEWWDAGYSNQVDMDCARQAWDFQQQRIDELEHRINELEHKLALREAFIAGLQFGKQAAQEQE